MNVIRKRTQKGSVIIYNVHMRRYRTSQPQDHYLITWSAGLDYHNFYINLLITHCLNSSLNGNRQYTPLVPDVQAKFCHRSGWWWQTAIRGMKALCQLAIDYGNGIVPTRIIQDVVESWFGHHRDAYGSNQNMSHMSKITITSLSYQFIILQYSINVFSNI